MNNKNDNEDFSIQTVPTGNSPHLLTETLVIIGIAGPGTGSCSPSKH